MVVVGVVTPMFAEVRRLCCMRRRRPARCLFAGAPAQNGSCGAWLELGCALWCAGRRAESRSRLDQMATQRECVHVCPVPHALCDARHSHARVRVRCHALHLCAATGTIFHDA